MISGLGRSPGRGHGNPLQYSYLENPHGQRSLAGYSPRGRQESDTMERLSTAHTGSRWVLKPTRLPSNKKRESGHRNPDAQIHTHRQTHRQTHRHTHTQTHTDTHTDTHRHTHTQRRTDTHTWTHTDTHTHTYAHTQTHTQTHTHRHTHMHTHRHIPTYTQIHTDTQTHRGKHPPL